MLLLLLGRWLGQASAAIHFEFADRITLTNVTVKHTGGWGVWLGAGMRNSTFRNGHVSDPGAGAVRLGEAGHGNCLEKNSPNGA